MSSLERNPHPGADRPVVAGDRRGLNPTPSKRSDPERPIRPAGSEALPRLYSPIHGSWDYNPAYPSIEMGQKLDELEAKANQARQQRQELAARQLATRASLELAAQPDHPRLKEQLITIKTRLTDIDQKLATIDREIANLKAELSGLCQ